ncbi:MAG: PqqD family protein [Dehalococcoidia bacterium]|nr:PqqD family protein [Dehalococcoidia bacterium]
MEKLKDLYFNDKGFIFDPESGSIYSLNTTGAFVVKQLQKGATVSQIGQEFRKNFEVNGAKIEKDLQEFLDLLLSYGFLIRSPS